MGEVSANSTIASGESLLAGSSDMRFGYLGPASSSETLEICFIGSTLGWSIAGDNIGEPIEGIIGEAAVTGS